MKSLGKILGLLFLGLLIVVVGALFALTHLFNPNDYKDEIRQLAREKANLELTLDGDIGWSLFPWLGLELHDTTMASASTPDKPFANARLLGVSVRVLPLLRRQVQMSDIRVDGLDLDLQVDEQGHGNWENVGHPPPSKAPQDSAPGSAAREQAAEPASRPLQLNIDSLSVKNSQVAYHDARSGRQYTAQNIELSSGAIREGREIPIKLTALLGTSQPPLQSTVDVQGRLRFDRALKRYQIDDARLSGELSGESLQGKTLAYSLQGDGLVDLAAQVAEWNNLKLTANQIRAIGELKARDLDKQAQFSGGLSVAEFDLREFLQDLGQTPPKTADGNALSKVELATRLAGDRNTVALEDLHLKLDGSEFNGRIALADLARRALRVELKGDRLNLDRYLPPKDEKSKNASQARREEVQQSSAAIGNGTTQLPDKPTRQSWSDESILPVERLRTLDLDASLSLGRLTLEALPIDDASLKVQSRDGVTTLTELRGDLYDGRFAANGQVDVRPPQPQLALTAHLQRVPVEPLVKSQTEQSPVKGALDLDADLSSSGVSQKDWIDGLNGTARFSVSDGVLVDANLEQQLCQGIALLNRESLSNPPSGRDTAFRQLGGSLTFHNGVASNPDLKAQVPGLTVKGNGDLDLRVLGLDYRVGVVIEGDQREMPDPACAVNERYAGIEWPLRCRGPLELGAKACRMDRDGMGKIAARLAGERIEQKIDEKLGDKVSPQLKDALKGLLKR